MNNNDELKQKLGSSGFDDLVTEQTWESGAIYVTEADLNNDGIVDYILEKTEGIAHCPFITLFQGLSSGQTKQVGNIDLKCGGDVSVLPISGFNYLLYTTDDTNQLARMNNGQIETICTF